MFDVFGVFFRSQKRILSTGEMRTFYNQLNLGLDPRGRLRAFAYSETVVISNYLDDFIVSLLYKSYPWKDVTEASGVIVLQIYYFKLPSY